MREYTLAGFSYSFGNRIFINSDYVKDAKAYRLLRDSRLTDFARCLIHELVARHLAHRQMVAVGQGDVHHWAARNIEGMLEIATLHAAREELKAEVSRIAKDDDWEAMKLQEIDKGIDREIEIARSRLEEDLEEIEDRIENGTTPPSEDMAMDGGQAKIVEPATPMADISRQLEEGRAKLRPGDRIVGKRWRQYTRNAPEERVVYKIQGNLAYCHSAVGEGGLYNDDNLPIRSIMRGIGKARHDSGSFRVYRFQGPDDILRDNIERGGRALSSYRLAGKEARRSYAPVTGYMDSEGRILSFGNRQFVDAMPPANHLYRFVVSLKVAENGNIQEPYCRLTNIDNPPGARLSGEALQRLCLTIDEMDRMYKERIREESDFTDDEKRLIAARVSEMHLEPRIAEEILGAANVAPSLNGMVLEHEEARERGALEEWDTKLKRVLSGTVFYDRYFGPVSAEASLRARNEDRVAWALDKASAAATPGPADGAFEGGSLSQDLVDQLIGQVNDEEDAQALGELVGNTARVVPALRAGYVRDVSDGLDSPYKDQFLARVWRWDDWSAPRGFADPAVRGVQNFVQEINSDFQEALSWAYMDEGTRFGGEAEAPPYWLYPAICGFAHQVIAPALVAQFPEDVEVYLARGRTALPRGQTGERSARNNWIMLRINGKMYYLSFTDGVFGWKKDRRRGDLLEQISLSHNRDTFEKDFLGPYNQGGFARVTLVPMEEAEPYFDYEYCRVSERPARDLRIPMVLASHCNPELLGRLLTGLNRLGNDNEGNNYLAEAVKHVGYRQPEMGERLAQTVCPAVAAGNVQEAAQLMVSVAQAIEANEMERAASLVARAKPSPAALARVYASGDHLDNLKQAHARECDRIVDSRNEVVISKTYFERFGDQIKAEIPEGSDLIIVDSEDEAIDYAINVDPRKAARRIVILKDKVLDATQRKDVQCRVLELENLDFLRMAAAIEFARAVLVGHRTSMEIFYELLKHKSMPEELVAALRVPRGVTSMVLPSIETQLIEDVLPKLQEEYAAFITSA